MIRDVIGKRYASAIYEIAESKKAVIKLNEDFQNVLDVYEGNKEFKNLVNHPSLTDEERKELIKKTFAGKIDEFSMVVLDYLIEKNRLVYLRSIAAEYLKIYYEANMIVEIEATFSIEPSATQLEKLTAKLEKMTEKKVKLDVKINKDILGGGMLKIGDKIIDGSLRRQFEMLKTNL